MLSRGMIAMEEWEDLEQEVSIDQRLDNQELKQYLEEIGKYPLLSKEEELECAKLARAGDLRAREKLINSNYRLVVNFVLHHTVVAKDKVMDAIQSGNLGLIEAVDRYNPDLGSRFSTYAFWVIKKSVYDDVYWKDQSFGVGHNQIFTFYRLKQLRDRYYEETGNHLTVDDMLKIVGGRQDTIQKLFVLDSMMVSLNDTVGKDQNVPMDEVIADVNSKSVEDEVEERLMRQTIRECLNETLTDKERDILKRRFGFAPYENNSQTLEEIGKIYHISREGVRQIEQKAKVKLYHARSLQGME